MRIQTLYWLEITATDIREAEIAKGRRSCTCPISQAMQRITGAALITSAGNWTAIGDMLGTIPIEKVFTGHRNCIRNFIEEADVAMIVDPTILLLEETS